jgi:putative ABC transport system permease protein
MELSFITNEKSQIALLKALGFRNIQIIKWHMYRFVIAIFIALILSGILVIPITKLWCDQVFGMMGANDINYFINPIHIYVIYPGIVLISTIIISGLAALATNKINSSDTASIE